MKKFLVFLAMFLGAFSLAAAVPAGNTSAITKKDAKAMCKKYKGKLSGKTCSGMNKTKKVDGKTAKQWCKSTDNVKKATATKCTWKKFTKEAADDGSGGNEPVDVGGTAGNSEEVDCGQGFLGFVPWYKGLTTEVNGRCEIATPDAANDGLTKFVITIILNILADLTLAVGYLALGFVIYGGFLYIMASGDPGKVAKGKKTLIAAVIGTAIAMSASVIMNLIVGALTS